MNIKFYSKTEAEKRYKEQSVAKFIDINVRDEYLTLRQEILEKYNLLKNNTKSYLFDLEFGMALYKIFNSKKWFTEILASDYSFWRYISLDVIPDIIYNRHGDKRDYFYFKNVRMYPSTIYWYIYIFHLDTDNNTRNLLSKNCFSTDTILQTIERSGGKGVNFELFKAIIERYSLTNEIKAKECCGGMNRLLRKVLIQNTAKNVVLIPEFYKDGIVGYVNMLFNSVFMEAIND